MKVKVKVREPNEVIPLQNCSMVIIEVKGNTFRIQYSPIYGLIINKVNIDDKGEDLISVKPRTGNEISIV